MTRVYRRTPFFALLLVCACSRSATREGEMRLERTAWVAADVVNSLVATETPQAIELHRPRDLSAFGDSILVVDSGNDRLVVLDAMLQPIRVMGRQGAGPGELAVPLAARIANEHIVVAELSNSRYSRLTFTGEPVGTVLDAAPSVSFGVLSNDDLLVPARSATDYLERVGPGGRVPFGARTDTLDEEAAKEAQLGGAQSFIAVTAGDTVHVLDAGMGVLMKYGPDGARVMERRLPSALLDSLIGRDVRVAKTMPKQDFRPGSFAKSLNASPDGRLLLMFRNGRTAGLVIDPRTYSARRLVTPTASLENNPPLYASTGMLLGDRLYIVGRGDVLVYALREERIR